MFDAVLFKIRNRFHPLYWLRSYGAFRSLQAYAPDLPIDFCGIKMFLSPIRDASWIALGDRLEERSRREFRSALRKHKVSLFIDVGANVGAYSWVALHEGVETVIMFEPDKTNARLIRKTQKKELP